MYRATNMSMFPTELIDIIVDHLHDDWLALLQCALVCRTWTVSSRYHLFRKIKIPLSPSAGDTDLHRAVQAFESAMGSQCGSYVRMCTITTTGSFYGYWDVEPCVSLATLGRLLSLLPRLQTLWTVNVAWPAASIKGSPILPSASVTSLIVCRVEASRDSKQQFKTVRDVMSVLCLLPALKTLATIRSCWEPQPLWDGLPTEEFPSFPAELKLETLDMRAPGPACILINFALGKLDLSALGSLTIWSFYTEDIPSIGKLIRAAAFSLKSLELRLTQVTFMDYSDEPTPEDECTQLSLAECTQLESLQLFVPYEQTGLHALDYVPPWDIVNAILATLPPTVQYITFIIDGNVHLDDMEESIDLVRWDIQTEAYKRLPALKRVTFCGGDSKSSEMSSLSSSIVDIIAEELHTLQHRGILKFY